MKMLELKNITEIKNALNRLISRLDRTEENVNLKQNQKMLPTLKCRNKQKWF